MTDILPPAGWPNVRQLETNEFATGGANGNMNEQAKSLAARSELLKQYAALPYESKTGGYALNERVQLATGDIVKSTVDGNANDPNVDMTGWVITDYQWALNAKSFGLKGDGTNESAKLTTLLTLASSQNRPINLNGLTITTSPIATTGHIHLVGTGGIKLFAGSNGTLLTSAYDIFIDGDIALDQDKVNNSGGTITGESHCTIKHSGDSLILRNGVVVKPSASNNIVSRAKKSLILENIDVDGGQICVYAIAPLAKVTMRGGSYKNSSLYDNIALYNAEDVSISGVTSKDSTRSGIVVNNTSKKIRIIGNLCLGNKRDGSNQGGWGIVCSVNTLDTVVNSNVCLGNQTGGITLDTFPAQGVESLDNRITVTGNTINGLYAGTYSTTGISLNNATHAVVTGNSIYKVGQGIATDSAHFANITGNTIQDVTSYFVQLYRSNDATVNSNTCDGCSNTSGGAISVADSSLFNIANNNVVNLTGGTGNAVRVSGTCTDWLVQNNKITRAVSGSGFVFHILGTANTGGVIKGNIVRALLTDAWQWAIVSDNSARFSTHDNIFTGINSGIARYIYQGNNVTAGDDTVNGSRNYWSSIPTAFKSRIGQITTIANTQKTWTGTAWVSANAVAVTYDPSSIDAGASVNTNVSVTGAVFGDFAQASFSSYDANIEITAVVSGTNQVTVKFKNIGAAPVDLGSGTLRVKVS